MAKFLPYYLNVDMDLPSEYSYHVDMFFKLFNWDIKWSDISYTNANLDIKDIQVKFVRPHDRQIIDFKFPALKSWKINANQKVNTWIMPSESKVELVFEDFKFDFKSNFRLDENGYLDPVMEDCDISFGNSYLYHDNQIVAFVMHQFIYFSIVIIENSVYFVGQYIFSNMMGPVLDTFLDHYRKALIIPSPLFGQNTYDIFRFDYRNVMDPFVGDGFADFFFAGELLDKNYGGCENMQPEPLEFSNNAYSQLVISNAAATCLIQTVSRSKIGYIHINEESVRQLFGDDKLKMTTASIEPMLPIFSEKLDSRDYPLKLSLAYTDPQVMFGDFDTDLVLTLDMEYRFMIDEISPKDLPKGVKRELIHDEVRVVLAANIEADDDVLYMNF